MGLFSKKPSQFEQMLEFMREERKAQAEVTKAMLESVAAQTKVISDYLEMFKTFDPPQVRIMTDADEISTEEKLRQRKMRDDKQALERMPVGFNDIGMFAGQMEDLFNNLKKEF